MATETEREFELVLGNRQLFSVLFIVIVLLAVFFAMGYVMGRNSAPVEVAARPPAPVRTESSPRQSAATGEPAVSTSAPPPAAAAAPAAEKPKPIEVSPIVVTEPQPGQSYWQLTAATRPVAEVVFESASEKGFRTLITPGPNDKLFRVLVGPAKDAAELSKLRTELEQAGFKPFLRKY